MLRILSFFIPTMLKSKIPVTCFSFYTPRPKYIVCKNVCDCYSACIILCVHTHSWPSHSCVRASSECRSDAHPGRRVSPALWIQPSASPSVSRTASHSCIAPLQKEKKKRHVQTQTLGSVEHYAKIQREQVPGLICLWRKHDKVSQCHTISRAADVGPSPKLQQRCFCANTQGCFSVRH